MTTYFDPIDYGFEFVGDWYRFDSKTAHSKARRARDDFAKKHGLKKGCLGKQLRTMGGIGSGHPEISEIVSVYYAF